MDRQLRQDFIYERVRDTREVRDEVARLIKLERRIRSGKLGDTAMHLMNLVGINCKIAALKWVLNHNEKI